LGVNDGSNTAREILTEHKANKLTGLSSAELARLATMTAKACRRRPILCEPWLLEKRCGVHHTSCRYLRWPTLRFEKGFEVLLATVEETGNAARAFGEALTKAKKVPTKTAWRGKYLRVQGSMCDGFWVRALLVIVIGTWAALNGLPFYAAVNQAGDSYHSREHGPSGWESATVIQTPNPSTS